MRDRIAQCNGMRQRDVFVRVMDTMKRAAVVESHSAWKAGDKESPSGRKCCQDAADFPWHIGSVAGDLSRRAGKLPEERGG